MSLLISNRVDKSVQTDRLDSVSNSGCGESSSDQKEDKSCQIEAAPAPKTKDINKSRKPYTKRLVKLASACEHTDMRSYALNMCKRCYHTKGRTKLATGCPHSDRRLYARNVCKGCYLKLYRSKL